MSDPDPVTIRAYTFGPFRLEADERRLLRAGVEVPLPPKVFTMLHLLIVHAGHLVTRERLLKDVWPDTFVEEANLTYTVSLLRKALGDVADAPTYIQTVAKQGYRFVAAVERQPALGSSSLTHASAPGAVHPAAEPAPEPAPVWWRTRGRSARASLGLVAAGLIAIGTPGDVAPHNGMRPRPPHVQVQSLAVLPFVNVSGRADAEWLASGVTTALIDELSRIRSLRVVSRDTSLQFRNTPQPVPDVSRQLGVDAVLVGSVLKEGDQVRIGLQLYEGATERVLWTHAYQRTFRSVLGLYSEVALTVARRVRAEVSPAEEDALLQARAVHPAAYEAYLRGKAAYARGDAAENERAIRHFEEALTHGPDFAPAMAQLALARYTRYFLGQRATAEELRRVMVDGRLLAEQAVRLGPTLADTHTALGWFRFWSLDMDAAEQSFLRALELNPSQAFARRGYGLFLNSRGRFEEAIAQLRHARDLDPSLFLMIASHGPLYCAGRLDEAATVLLEAKSIAPDNPLVHRFLGKIRSMQGRHEEAVIALRASHPYDDDSSSEALTDLVVALVRGGRRAEAIAALADLEARARRMHVPPGFLARAYGWLGDRARAERALATAYEHPADLPWMTTICDPLWDSVRDLPLFQRRLDAMGVPPDAPTRFTLAERARRLPAPPP